MVSCPDAMSSVSLSVYAVGAILYGAVFFSNGLLALLVLERQGGNMCNNPRFVNVIKLVKVWLLV